MAINCLSNKIILNNKKFIGNNLKKYKNFTKVLILLIFLKNQIKEKNILILREQDEISLFQKGVIKSFKNLNFSAKVSLANLTILLLSRISTF